MFVLIVHSGKHTGRKVRLNPGRYIIGRDEQAKLRVASSEVSREHCELIVSATEVRVSDLDSRNGTFIDGVPIHEETVLPPGGKLTVGPMTFRLDGGQAGRRTVDVPGLLNSEDKAKLGLSDDDIAALLTDDSGALSASDTTVVGGGGELDGSGQRPLKREFKSIAEEAREIIRLHRASLETGSGGPAR